MLKSFSEEITVILNYESQRVSVIKCKNDIVMENILMDFALQIKVEFTSLMFLHGGERISNFKQTFYQLMTEEDKNIKEINILVYKINKSLIQQSIQPNFINIIFRKEWDRNIDIVIKKIKREATLKNVCEKYTSEIGCNLNSIIFKYDGNEIDINKKFDDIANDYDKDCFGMTIFISKINNLTVNFLFKDFEPFSMKCNKEDKMQDIFYEYAKLKALDLNNLSFKYGIAPINIDDKTLNQVISSIESASNVDLNTEKKTSESFNKDYIDIIVSEITETHVSFFKKYKKLIIGLSIIIIVVLITLIAILLKIYKPKNIIYKTSDTTESDTTESDTTESDTTESDTTESDTTESDTTTQTPLTCEEGYYLPYDYKTLGDCQKCSLEGCVKCNGTYDNNECTSCGNLKNVYYNNKIIKCNNTCELGEDCIECYKDKNECKKCNNGYKKVNGICKPDYFIKAIYLSSSDGEEVTLFNSWYTSSVIRMIIDGNNITPTSKYNFPKEGSHTVYYKFKKYYQ